MILKGNTRDRRSRTWRRSRRYLVRTWPRCAADALTRDMRLERGRTVIYFHIKLGKAPQVTPAGQP